MIWQKMFKGFYVRIFRLNKSQTNDLINRFALQGCYPEIHQQINHVDTKLIIANGSTRRISNHTKAVLM